QLRRVTAEGISTGRVESAAVYCETELDASAMALGGLGHHAPVSVERRGNCGRSETAGCGSGRQRDGTDTVADHASPPVLFRRLAPTMKVRPVVIELDRSPMSLANMSALPPKADMCVATRDVRYGPKADIRRGGDKHLLFW